MIRETVSVAGHRGTVGSAIVRELMAQGVPESQIITHAHSELDLTNQLVVQQFFSQQEPTPV